MSSQTSQTTGPSGGPGRDEALRGRSIRILTDGRAHRQGWLTELETTLKQQYGARVETWTTARFLAGTILSALGEGADALLRTLGLSRTTEAESDARALGRTDLVIVDHPSAARPVDLLRQAVPGSMSLMALLDGYTAESAWHGQPVDAWIAPDTALLAELPRADVPAALRLLAGPPDAPATAVVEAGIEERGRWGLDGSRLVVVTDVRCWSADALDTLVLQLAAEGTPAEWLFYSDTDGMAAQLVRDACARHGLRGRLFGRSAQSTALLATADLAVLGSSRWAQPYASLGTPMVSADPADAGHALARRGALVALQGAGAVARTLSYIVSQGIDGAHRQAAASLQSRDGALRVADAIATGYQLLHGAQAGPGGPYSGTQTAEPVGVEAPLSREDAKRQLAALILEERRLENDVGRVAGTRDQWMQRLSLAQEANDPTLVAAAQARVDAELARLAALQSRLTELQQRKETVRRRVAGQIARPATDGGPAESADMEARFRALEQRRDLDRLRRLSGQPPQES